MLFRRWAICLRWPAMCGRGWRSWGNTSSRCKLGTTGELRMLSSNARIGVAAFLEQCAQQRARSSSLRYEQDDPTRLARMLQAEAAGRELMAALVRPDPYPDM